MRKLVVAVFDVLVYRNPHASPPHYYLQDECL
jgi:hypothetical protein